MVRGRFAPFVAFPVAAFQLIGTHLAGKHQPDAQPLDVLAYVLVVGSGLILFWRSRYPEAVLAGVAGAVVLYHALDYPNGPIFLSLVIALFNAVMKGRRAAAWITAGA